MECVKESKKDSKYQESTQSSTTPVVGRHSVVIVTVYY